MKEKHKNDCNILIMTFTNLEKYVYSKKCLKKRRQPPLHHSLQQCRRHFPARKSHLATAVICHFVQAVDSTFQVTWILDSNC